MSTDVYSEVFLPLMALALAVCLCSWTYLVWISEWQVIELPLICQHMKPPAQKWDVFSDCLCVGKHRGLSRRVCGLFLDLEGHSTVFTPCTCSECSDIQVYWWILTFAFVMAGDRSSCGRRKGEPGTVKVFSYCQAFKGRRPLGCSVETEGRREGGFGEWIKRCKKKELVLCTWD